jgi:DNA-binding NarL/FixJ family response regulator
MNEDVIRVLLVEENFYTRLGTAVFLSGQPGIVVVGMASDGESALALFATHSPDVTVLDLRLRGMNGLQVISALLEKSPDAAILVLSQYLGDHDISRALKAGARGYISKDASGNDLVAALRTLRGGARFIPTDIRRRVSSSAGLPGLTRRERQVLEQVADGASNREAAAALGISHRTVDLYVSNILDKLGAQSRTEAVSIATHRGILRPYQQGRQTSGGTKAPKAAAPKDASKKGPKDPPPPGPEPRSN